MKGYECEISIGLDDDIYHLYMDGTVYGDTSKLEQLFNKLLTELQACSIFLQETV